jgi:hypothetical protein
MTELERALHALARDVDWPTTPELSLQLEPRPSRRSRRRALVLVLALLLLALAVSFAVPSARTAILRFLHLRGATVELVGTLPQADERALGADLGTAVSLARSEQELGFRMLLPPDAGSPPVHVLGSTGSVLLQAPGPVLLTELRPVGITGPELFKKVAGSGTDVQWVQVNGAYGIWLSGSPHVFFAPSAPPRLAGNVLLWERGDLTLRLEGKSLTKEAALRLARSIR